MVGDPTVWRCGVSNKVTVLELLKQSVFEIIDEFSLSKLQIQVYRVKFKLKGKSLITVEGWEKVAVAGNDLLKGAHT